MIMVLTLQRRLKKSLQIKKIITNPPWVLSQILISSIIAKKLVTKTSLMQLKKAAEVAQKKEQQLVHDECYLQWK